MELDAWLTLVVVLATVALLATERASPPFVLIGGVTALLTVGVIDVEQAFTGFSNPAPITVAALYVLAAAAEKTHLLDTATSRLLGSGGRRAGTRLGLARVLVPTAASSAFLNNTPIVAMVAPAVVAWARRAGVSPSLFLIPVSFAAILGGVVTLIGTSTNLVVSGLLRDAGHEPLGLFEIGQVGLPLAVAGLAVLVFLGPRLLPERTAPSTALVDDVREFTVEMVVAEGSPLAGRSVADAELRNLEGVYLVAIERDGDELAPVAPGEILREGDRLTFAGNVERVVDLQQRPGLASAEQRHFAAVASPARRRLFEAVIAPGSPLVGSTLKRSSFRARHNAAVLAVHRSGDRVPGKLGDVTLRAGDVLLLVSTPDFRRAADRRDFLVVAALDGDPPRREQAPLVGIVLVGLLVLAGTGTLDILVAALLAAFALVGLGVLSPTEARNAVNLNVVLVIAASFGLGAAMTESGLAEELAALFIGPLGDLGDVGLLLGVLLATSVLTEVITNNAAAVLMFPIALATAEAAGLDPRPFAIVIALGASSSFLTPIGYQTNTMVYGMGGYRFGDFARVGVPLTAVMVVVAAIFVPLAWPLR